MGLINADALVNDATERYCKDCERRKGIKNGKRRFIYDIGDAPCRACGVYDMIDDLENAPTVDAVEVVRCKDCKWHITSEFYALGNDRVPYETTSDCLKWHDYVPVDFYCAFGERREDGKTGKG